MVNKGMLAGAKIVAGETVALVLDLDTAERCVAVPEELEAALKLQPAAAAAFAALSYSHRKEYADWIGGAKKQETRLSRAEKCLGMIVAADSKN